MKKSKNVYRVPYASGTKVKITGDHISHNPPGRIDMFAKGSGDHQIVAAADGRVRFIVDTFDGPVASGQPCTNNYVWIEHANDEWSKYSHLRQHSATGTANLSVGQFVKAGTFLGIEDDVGCANGSHLHFEIGKLRKENPITTTGGFIKDNAGSKRNRIPRICGITGGIFVDGKTYTARKVPGTIAPGGSEVARHGLPLRDFQCHFDQAVAAGYRLDWIDGYNVAGKVFFNCVWRPASGSWRAYVHQSATQFQKRFNDAIGDGLSPVHVESYRSGSGVRYAVIFEKRSGAFLARHGLSLAQHRDVMNDAKSRGLSPVNISVVSVDGRRRYTVLYRTVSTGSWRIKSRLDGSGYQKAVEANLAAGRKPVYVAGYKHKGKNMFSAVFARKPAGKLRARHGLSSAGYQSAFDDAIGDGFRTEVVTGIDGAVAKHRYAAVWRK